MLSAEEKTEIRDAVHSELAHIEKMVHQGAGSYPYLCVVAGVPTYTHAPVGTVLRYISPHPASAEK